MTSPTPLALLIALLLVGALPPANAELRLPRIFGDHMILQHQTESAIWGWSNPGKTVVVTASWDQRATAEADTDGAWMAFLPTPRPGTNHTVTVAVQGSDTKTDRLTFKDVAIGEVWLAAGQSNMGWATGNTFHADEEADVDLPGLRIFRSAREHWHEPLTENRDRLARWKPCDGDAALETSAVAYHFGKTLHEALGIPVGIIQRAYAGTPIEGWMPWDIQADDPRAVAHRAPLDALSKRRIARGETHEKAIAAFEAQLADYNARVDAGDLMKNASRKIQPPIITRPSNLGHQYPAHIYNAMIHPIIPYGIRGMIWYQGERNAKNAAQAAHYTTQLNRMITHYRSAWHNASSGRVSDGFPVQITQLPSWNPPQTKPVEGPEASWAVSREAMLRASQSIIGCDLVVTIDTGDAIELHPKNKRPIGRRHALLALANTYGLISIGSGPTLREVKPLGDKLRLSFDNVGSGLLYPPEKIPKFAFAIAGADRRWHWANARIQLYKGGKPADSLVLSSHAVPNPTHVRYAWAMNPSQRDLLYNYEGFPASPFRTDDWPLFDPDAEPIEVNKPAKPKGYKAEDWARPGLIGFDDLPE